MKRKKKIQLVIVKVGKMVGSGPLGHWLEYIILFREVIGTLTLLIGTLNCTIS